MAEEKEKKEVKDQPAAPETPAPAATPAEGAAPAAVGAEGEAAKPVKRKSAKGARTVPLGIVHIRATFNNTMVTVTDMRGAVLCWSTSGRCGFKGSRKSTAYAATVVAQEAARQAVGYGMHEVEVQIQGPGAGRESAIRAIQSAGLTVTVIRDVTPVPHNGCRPPKRRRV
jgi:small subunit ribosomal protein S11